MQRIVVKIGSNILTHSNGRLNHKRIHSIAHDVSLASEAGYEVVLVSSGAIAAGMEKMGLTEKPTEIVLKQAAAAAGQSSLMRIYERSFGRHNKKVAQILLTRNVVSFRPTYLNSRNTLNTLLSYGLIPIVNENDTVATDEIKFGDNDHLAAIVAGLIDADRLIILSDVDGLYSADPKKDDKARIIPFVREITPALEARAGGAGSRVGTGGMYSKLLAAKKATSFGIGVNIISGKRKGLLISLLGGTHHGTEFISKKRDMTSRKAWIAYAMSPRGKLVLDDGAVHALMNGGKSLLPSGIISIEGNFGHNEAVVCLDQNGNRIAKGIVNYSSLELDMIKGKKTSEIQNILGVKHDDEIIHRDNMVILQK
ncbi:MAG TPA: glutamate 5-kinase [Dissulfurispiraceae bacterium]|nr:glutamate 5-kinase [Dissulfurispiraceae bacterium]